MSRQRQRQRKVDLEQCLPTAEAKKVSCIVRLFVTSSENKRYPVCLDNVFCVFTPGAMRGKVQRQHVHAADDNGLTFTVNTKLSVEDSMQVKIMIHGPVFGAEGHEVPDHYQVVPSHKFAIPSCVFVVDKYEATTVLLEASNVTAEDKLELQITTHQGFSYEDVAKVPLVNYSSRMRAVMVAGAKARTDNLISATVASSGTVAALTFAAGDMKVMGGVVGAPRNQSVTGVSATGRVKSKIAEFVNSANVLFQDDGSYDTAQMHHIMDAVLGLDIEAQVYKSLKSLSSVGAVLCDQHETSHGMDGGNTDNDFRLAYILSEPRSALDTERFQDLLLQSWLVCLAEMVTVKQVYSPDIDIKAEMGTLSSTPDPDIPPPLGDSVAGYCVHYIFKPGGEQQMWAGPGVSERLATDMMRETKHFSEDFEHIRFQDCEDSACELYNHVQGVLQASQKPSADLRDTVERILATEKTIHSKDLGAQLQWLPSMISMLGLAIAKMRFGVALVAASSASAGGTGSALVTQQAHIGKKTAGEGFVNSCSLLWNTDPEKPPQAGGHAVFTMVKTEQTHQFELGGGTCTLHDVMHLQLVEGTALCVYGRENENWNVQGVFPGTDVRTGKSVDFDPRNMAAQITEFSARLSKQFPGVSNVIVTATAGIMPCGNADTRMDPGTPAATSKDTGTFYKGLNNIGTGKVATYAKEFAQTREWLFGLKEHTPECANIETVYQNVNKVSVDKIRSDVSQQKVAAWTSIEQCCSSNIDSDCRTVLIEQELSQEERTICQKIAEDYARDVVSLEDAVRRNGARLSVSEMQEGVFTCAGVVKRSAQTAKPKQNGQSTSRDPAYHGVSYDQVPVLVHRSDVLEFGSSTGAQTVRMFGHDTAMLGFKIVSSNA